MKKLFISLFFISIFSFGFNNTSSAALDEVACVTATIICGDGTGGNALVCGSSVDEMIDEALEFADVICG
jgi:hypothetical protein